MARSAKDNSTKPTLNDSEQFLRELYFNPKSPASYSSISKLWKEVKSEAAPIKYKEVKEFMENIPTYQLHKPAMKKFLSRKTMVSYAFQQFQADLVDMQKFSRDNNGYNYILTVIDVFSRYAWSLPLKSKRGEDVKDLFQEVFRDGQPEKIQFDEGKEFYNKHLKDYLEQNNIEYFSSFSDKKAAVCERYNKSLKGKMWKYFTQKETEKWVDILPDLVYSYNHTFHSSIGMKPVDAIKEENEDVVWYNLYGAFLANDFGSPKFKVGDSVRISKYKTVFTKGYLPNYTEEVFKIKQVVYTKPFVYKLQDYHEEEITGYFYEQELSYVPNPEDIEYKIDKVLRYKTIKGKKYGLVKWKGYSEKFNEWLPVENIQTVNP